MRNIFPFLNFVLILTVIVYLYLQTASTQAVYVLNNELFAKFKGTQELQAKLKTLRERNTAEVDSLIEIGQRNLNNREVLDAITRQQERMQLDEQQVSEQYTVDIWKRINAYMKEFGKENGYRIVFGATGDGTIMYAEDALNVTEEAVEFINSRYQEGE